MSGLLNFDPWPTLELRAQGIRNEIMEEILIQGYGKKFKGNNSIKIIVRNTTTQPVEIKGFSLETNFGLQIFIWWQQRKKSSGHENQVHTNVILFGQGNGFRQTEKDEEFIIHIAEFTEPLIAHVRFLGSPNSYIDCVIPVDESSFNPELLPTNKSSRFNRNLFPFILEENETLWIPPGHHVCKDHLYIASNQKLKISPGAEILFDRNSTFVSEGSVQFLGTKTDPIIISSSSDTWAGFLLANASGNSVFENVKFSNVSGIGKGPNPQGITQNGWTLTGGITSLQQSS